MKYLGFPVIGLLGFPIKNNNNKQQQQQQQQQLQQQQQQPVDLHVTLVGPAKKKAGFKRRKPCEKLA